MCELSCTPPENCRLAGAISGPMTSAEVERRVREVVARSVLVSPGSIGARVPLEALWPDRVEPLVLIDELEAAFGLHIPEQDWLQLTTVQTVASYLASRLARPAELGPDPT